MSLFQKSVEKKYVSELDSNLIDQKYKQFQDYFGNSEIQENIKNAKEEQFQEGFLRELFVKIFGYILNPQPNFNLTTELKNIANSRKADGAILKNGNALAVIELKGTNTTDLDSIESQAFGYKNHHPKCVYVITSNFEKLRFYIQNAVEHIDFDLFNLSREQFSLMWLCLASENLLNDLPLKIKESSLVQEKNITKQLYADYSTFREVLFANLVKNNSDKDKLLLFNKTQKLLDRFLFIFFAEDRLLLPPNSINEIVRQWKTLKEELDEYVPLYDRFKKYFGYMNTGYKGKKYEIYAYNGGLFAPDEILDNISIDDDILHEHILKLSSYDFETDIDVNILGHIFEHSLSEIENVQAAIAASTGHAPLTETNITKRKKDGIFYTPKYITKYIVENTIGKLCEEKRSELNIVDEEYVKGRKNRKKDTIKILDDKLTNYRNWLLSLTILDPACGSGAFLNQALDFLITEHRKIDNLKAQLFDASLILSDITTDILEKNIYGVDLNEESVEIAKLSLWLRTAQKGRKLNKLNKNIKCGNSLIDDPEVAGDKAFNWQKEFPNIFREKQKKAWHVTTATHNSRYSQRMFDNHVVLGESEWFDERDAIIITETIAEIAKKDDLNILAYNICGDHMHILLVCEEEELTKIVGKLKSVSAKMRNLTRGHTSSSDRIDIPLSDRDTTLSSTRGHAPLSDYSSKNSRNASSSDIPNRIDASKRGETQRQVWTQKFGKSEIKDDEYLYNAIEYIRKNRTKHELPDINKGLQPLVDKMVCTYEHAFRTEYKGGFDVVIGNPPYVRQELLGNVQKIFFSKKYTKVFNGTADLYVYFYNLSLMILKPNGLLGFITPNKWMERKYGVELRNYLKSFFIHQIVNYGELKIFEDASTEPQITILENVKSNADIKYAIVKSLLEAQNYIYNIDSYKKENLEDAIWRFTNHNIHNILKKFNDSAFTLNDYTKGGVYYGIKTGLNEAFIINETTKNKIVTKDYNSNTILKKMVEGDDFKKWSLLHSGRYMVATEFNLDIPQEYPAVFEYLKQFEDKLIKRQDKGLNYWNLRSCDYYNELDKPKLIYYHTAVNHNFFYDTEGYYISANCYFIANADRYLQCILNSKLFNCVKKYLFPAFGDSENGGRIRLDANKMIKLPIKIVSDDLNLLFSKKAELITLQSNQLQDQSQKFQRTIERKFELEELPNKLQNWYLFSYTDFITELGKKKIKLSLSQEAEWEDYFLAEQQKAQTLKSEIEKTDKEIDQLVYQLYDLTAEEIEIIENSIK